MVTKWSPLPIKEGGTDGTTPKSARRALGISEGVSSDNFVSVKDFPFGAVGDGVTDDTAAIQAAINAAGTTGWVLITPNVIGTYTNPNNIPILDLRNFQIGLWSVFAPSFPVANFPGGNDLVLRTRGPADTYIEKLKAACTTAVALAVGANTNFLVGAVTVGNTTRGNLQTGTTSLLSTSAPLFVGRETANEEVVASGNWSIIDGTHLSVTCAKTHAGTTDIEQLGSVLITAYDILLNSTAVKPSQNTTYNAPIRIKDSSGNVIVYLPGNINDSFPQSLVRWAWILSGAQGANNDLLFQHNTSSSQVKWRSAAGNTVTTLDNNGAIGACVNTAIPAGGTAGQGVMVSSTSNFGVFFGSGGPTLSAAKGSLYLRSDGTTNVTRMYVNTDGGTTWTAVNTVA